MEYKGKQDIWKGKVPCLASVTGFNSKLVFNLADQPHYNNDQATQSTWLGFEPRTFQFRRKCSTKLTRPDKEKTSEKEMSTTTLCCTRKDTVFPVNYIFKNILAMVNKYTMSCIYDDNLRFFI